MKTQHLFLLSLYFFVLSSCSGERQPIDYVDPFIGTGFHGHTYPGATTPFGAVQLSPDTRFGNWDACSGYHYSDSLIYGFSHTHLSGTGCIDLGDVLFHPTTKELNLESKPYIFEAHRFSHQNEKASPGYYSVDLKESGIKAELTATTHAGMHQYSFREGEKSCLVIDMAHLLTDETIDSVWIKKTGENEISGMRRTQGWVENQYVFFVAQFSEPFEKVDIIDNGKLLANNEKASSKRQQAVLKFKLAKKTPLVAKLGISIVSVENARENLDAEIEGFDFDAVRKQAEKTWNETLSEIEIKGGSEERMTNFYTALYHSKLSPNIMSDFNGEYRRHNMEIAQQAKNKKYYSTLSLWDTFRAWHPLQTLTNTDLVTDIINSCLDMYNATGELPIWPLSSGETRTMIGYHSASVIVDAYMKGIRGFDVKKAFEAMKISSTINKKGADYYLKYGFIPSNIKKESVSCLLEYAYDDWCIAQMAKELGEEEDYKRYSERAQSYINVFDGATSFFRGKRLDGNWDNPFNPLEPGRAYTEATAWQYRFFVPHDVNGLIQLFGGKEKFTEKLDNLFSTSSEIDGKMVDITGLIGQYAHGNEPSHHMAYLYNYVGEPWKTQAMTRRILDEMYQPTPEGISGNEDCGQMSAWYILSSLGFYSVCPGTNEFSLSSPLFEEAKIRLASGKTLTIKSNEPEKNSYIDKLTLNGKEIIKNFISYEDLMQGGELRFYLSPTPNKTRGTAPSTAPYSQTKNRVVSIPFINKDLNLFVDSINFELGTQTEAAKIYYTLNGSEPNEDSKLYTRAIELKNSAAIKARAYKKGYLPSTIFNIYAEKAVFQAAIKRERLKNGTNYSYYEGNYKSVNEIKASEIIESSTMPEPSISNAKRKDHFAYVFSGYIDVPENDVYEFMTKSDDGSVLYIGTQKVVDNDGSHAAIIATGRIALKKGLHPYRLLYFEDYEGEALSWAWRRAGKSNFEKISPENLFIN